MIDLILGPLAPILTALGGAVIAFFFGYHRANTVRRMKDAEKRLRDIEAAKDIRDEIESDPYLSDRAREWVRPNKR